MRTGVCSTQRHEIQVGRAGATLLAVIVAVAGCGTATTRSATVPSPTTLRPKPADGPAVNQTPEQATTSWFAAINAKNKAEAVADFEPSSANQMNWGYGDVSTWPTFSGISCKPVSHDATSASVYCTFSESEAPAVGNPDTFWTVHLQRRPGSRWLISNYGQG
jgi:hypothetical protein